ncbi:hypothetical protein MCAG_01905 [Micromonospora sp. ATCC 39149]|uniref:Uncharacterized protein n=1 Tax=Micromonospora carbonacea TaxID=47853 RepID=A0A7D5YHI4_9ACTN|nr:hypothetical protein [Micromonospora sp. ATCC 39149]EEP71578.1 hypothetical protein MCAG_01905 [Micromonospora sp. ATCC 39149]QLJ97834.1 hypothetical protein HZU44_24220 [Micromonospora carbonacea]
MISNSEMIRIRRQMQRRIRDVVAERRRARQMEATVVDLTGDPTDARPESSLTPTA